MRILYHHRTRSRDGQAVHIEELIGALRRQGHEVVVVGPQGTREAEFGADAGGVAKLKRLLPKAVYELMELAYSVVEYRALIGAMRRTRPDAIYQRANLFMLSGLWLAQRFKIPLLVEVNAPLAEERGRYDGLALTRLARWSEQALWRAASVALPVTGVLADKLNQAGVDRARIRIIPNGVDLVRFAREINAAPRRRALGINGLVLGFVGFVRDWHGVDEVVRALALPDAPGDAVLMIVGDGPARAGLEQLARELGLADRVRFTGVVPREEVAGYVALFDIALQPRAVDYASPLKLIEYMAQARAILAPDQPNIREVLDHDHSALLFDPAKPGALAEALRRLWSDAALRRRLGAEARAAIDRKGLTWDANAKVVADLARGAVSHTA